MNLPVFSGSVADLFKNLPDPITSDLRRLDQLIHEQLHSDALLAREVSEHIINAGGKRIRPLLVMLIARALGYTGENHHKLAAIIEFIHTASLLHDDVVDESSLRRGVESANARFGNAASVLVGDFMHTRAFQMMISLKNMRVMEILAEATNTIAEGEIFQLMKMSKTDVDEADYFKIIYAKTAKLFEAAASLGATIISDDANVCLSAARYGKAFGTAFQLIDDCLDYSGNQTALGKETGNDLKEGKMTLPLIYLMQHGTAHEKNIIKQYIEYKEVAYFEEIFHAVRKSGALQYVSQKADEMVKEALSAVAAFPDTVYRSCLTQLCHFSICRQY